MEAENSPKIYKDLTRKEKRALAKEFNAMWRNFKIWCAIMFIALFSAAASVIFNFLYIFERRDVFLILYTSFYLIFVIIQIFNVVLSSKRNRNFFEWLKNDKNIVKYEGINGEVIKNEKHG